MWILKHKQQEPDGFVSMHGHDVASQAWSKDSTNSMAWSLLSDYFVKTKELSVRFLTVVW